MASEKLLHVLENFKDEEFTKFKWFLQQPGLTHSRCETVTEMVQTYGDTAAVEVTRKVLEKMSRKDLVQRLSDSSSELGATKPKMNIEYVQESHTSSVSVRKVSLIDEQIDIQGCKRFMIGKQFLYNELNRTIMLLGVTGSGKSTLINGMINYVLGVKWEDSYRYKLVDELPVREAKSRTSEVTVYKLYHQEGFKVPFSLTIIDTPGFGDAKDRDEKIISEIYDLFSAQHGVTEIDAVCFVARASLDELTPTHKFISESLQNIFGKDVKENIRVLVTFCDKQQPPVLNAIKAAGVPCHQTTDGLPVHFTFNNSALFANNKHTDSTDHKFWMNGEQSMKTFFTALNLIRTKSLTLEIAVLKERRQLRHSVYNLEKQVEVAVANLVEIKVTREKLEALQINTNENFEFEVKVKKPRKVYVFGYNSTNCERCQHTCHHPCPLPTKEDKFGCDAMGPDGRCTLCPGRCSWKEHVSQTEKWVYSDVTEKRTLKGLKQKYLQATTEQFRTVELLNERLVAETHEVQNKVLELVKEIIQGRNRLKDIDKKEDPNYFSTVQYIGVLIKKEMSERKPGWEQRVTSLNIMRQRAQFIQLIDCVML